MGIGKWNGVDIGRKWNGVWTQGSGMMCAYREVEWCGYREVEWCGYREVEWCGDTEREIMRGHRKGEWCGHKKGEWCGHRKVGWCGHRKVEWCGHRKVDRCGHRKGECGDTGKRNVCGHRKWELYEYTWKGNGVEMQGKGTVWTLGRGIVWRHREGDCGVTRKRNMCEHRGGNWPCGDTGKRNQSLCIDYTGKGQNYVDIDGRGMVWTH